MLPTSAWTSARNNPRGLVITPGTKDKLPFASATFGGRIPFYKINLNNMKKLSPATGTPMTAFEAAKLK